jgi:hypothetical protein
VHQLGEGVAADDLGGRCQAHGCIDGAQAVELPAVDV